MPFERVRFLSAKVPPNNNIPYVCLDLDLDLDLDFILLDIYSWIHFIFSHFG